MRYLLSILPEDETRRFWFSVLITMVLAGILSTLGIFGFGEYGIALFIIIPTFLGFAPVVLWKYGRGEISHAEAGRIAFTTTVLFMFTLFIFAMEGLICILMAAPIAFLFMLFGYSIARALVNANSKKPPSIMMFLFMMVPLVSFVEQNSDPTLHKVSTSIIIDAPPEKVWSMVVEFPELDPPKELMFKTGISYPTSANIEGHGVGAIRYCNFSTGRFVEPITKWEEPYLLEFDVEHSPPPMTEMTFWDIDAPHLHDYFQSKKGQFKLVELSDGRTELIGTTWYHNRIRPTVYWNLWSNYIVHRIHYRVLRHIKENSEKR